MQLANDKLLALIAPARVARSTNSTSRAIRHNLLATLARRPEAYHRRVLAGAQNGNGDCASIHERVVFKQAGLDKRVQYDAHPRKSLLDHFYNDDVTLDQVVTGQAAERGDFSTAAYEPRVRRNPDRIQVLLIREGIAAGVPVRIIKGVTLNSGEFGFGDRLLAGGAAAGSHPPFRRRSSISPGCPPGAEDRYFHDLGEKHLGQLGDQLDLKDVRGLGLVDQWLGMDVRIAGFAFHGLLDVSDRNGQQFRRRIRTESINQ